ncbi:HAD family hydrolase [Thauera butanivorans]|uniref:HAD family hydrolase n=1 Tax=Thauera butanivorans TaxID=86174 RepID=UPI00083889B2|nr:HAD-IA family hydrolase [Thauera butanivorans]
MRFRAVIFDLDDTIHDKSATLRTVAARLFIDHGLSNAGVDENSWNREFGYLNNLRIEKKEVFAKLKDRFALTESAAQSLLADFDANLGSQAQAYPGVVECLAACKAAGLKLALVTNGRDEFQKSKVAGMGVTRYFDAIFTSGSFGAKKPHPSIFEACLQSLGVEASETAVVGDDLKCDIEPAVSLGMTPVWKSSEPSSQAALSTEDFGVIQAFLTNTAEPSFEKDASRRKRRSHP